MVYLHAGLNMASFIPYAIHWESNKDSHGLGTLHATWRVLTVQIGSRTAKMAKFVVSVDRPG